MKVKGNVEIIVELQLTFEEACWLTRVLQNGPKDEVDKDAAMREELWSQLQDIVERE